MPGAAQPGLLNPQVSGMNAPGQAPVAPVSTDPMSGRYSWGFDPGSPLGPNNKLPGQSYYSPLIDQGLIPQQEKQDSKFFQDFSNYGLPSSNVPLTNSLPMNGNSNPMVQAIQNQNARQMQNSLQGIVAENAANAPVAGQREQSVVAQELGQEYKNQVDNYNQQLQYENEAYNLMVQNEYMQNATQAQLMSQIFGGMGSFAGSMFGAGQAGGQVGNLVGKGVGAAGGTA